MADESHLDRKYFIDEHIYNCPFCKRRHVTYSIISWFQFNWTEKKICTVYLVQCGSCKKISMHLSYELILQRDALDRIFKQFRSGIDIDAKIFYSVPSSTFVLDSRIPEILRELIAESEGCLKMNFLTGASACARKAIYELTVREKAEGDDYGSKIKFLKSKYPSVDATLFDVLSHIQDMTSDKVHEQSWPKWESGHPVPFSGS